ncbi:hypothetical protein KWD51_13385 [Acinetobacter baumannii]|uniref:hypothetical protein n=1 Tax=Acinetobacter baumannii TaxID=470 RepID=UPI0009167D21|nr:hypothetical protein A7N09_16595 [Acinetobacter baumannii]
MIRYIILLFFIIPSIVYADINNGTMTAPGRNRLGQMLLEQELQNRKSSVYQGQQVQRQETIHWESASNTGKSATGDLNYTNCFYKTMGGYSFSIVVRSSFCPYSVDVNPESGRVRY